MTLIRIQLNITWPRLGEIQVWRPWSLRLAALTGVRTLAPVTRPCPLSVTLQGLT
jgi:hypothetical protein